MEIIQSISGHLTPYASETITVAGAAIGFTSTKLTSAATQTERDNGKCRMVLVTVDGAPMRFTMDGTPPVAGVTGHAVQVDGSLSFANFQTMSNFRAINEDGTNNTKLQVTYFR